MVLKRSCIDLLLVIKDGLIKAVCHSHDWLDISLQIINIRNHTCVYTNKCINGMLGNDLVL